MSKQKKSMFHSGHRELQDRFDGRRVADALEKHRRLESFRDEDIQFIAQSEFFFLASAYDDSVDCSFKGGHRGFVRVTGANSLQWDDYDGNSMYRSLGNILKSPRVGLLFIRFGEEPKRLRVNGLCELEKPVDDAGKLVVNMEADEIFPNCPRYIPNLTESGPTAYLPDESGIGAKPAWKSMDVLRGALPDNDPHRGQ